MYSYKVLWYTESADSDTGEINYEETTLGLLKKTEKKDGKFTVVEIHFGHIPDVEVYDKAVLRIFDGNKRIIMENTLEIYENGNVEIHESTGSYKKVSLEECTLVGNELHCEVYWA